jgi:hypothetical protein
MYFSKITKINFGKNIGYQIKDINHIKLILQRLYTLIGKNTYNYTRITNKEDLDYLKFNKYKVGPKFVGIESLFFICKINQNYYNVLIYKEKLNQIFENNNFNYVKIFKIKISLPKKFYKGILFDGIIFNENKKINFIVNDIIINNGKLVENGLTERHEELNDILNYINSPNFVFGINSFCDIETIKDLYYNKIKNSNYNIDGLVFIDQKNVNNIFKIYSNEQQSKQIYGFFNMTKYNLTDVYILECMNNDKLQKWGIARISNMKKSLFYQNIFKTKKSIVVKCIYNYKFRKWEPIDIVDKNNISDMNKLKNLVYQDINY